MNHWVLRYASVLLIGVSFRPVHGQQTDASVDAASTRALIRSLVERLHATYVFPDVADAMARDLEAREANGEYDSVTDGTELARQITDHLRQISADGHLGVEFAPEPQRPPPSNHPQGPTAEDIARFREAGRRRNFEFRKVERLDGSIGLIQIDGFYPGEWIGDTVAAAMSFLANCDAIILDLRTNGGGAPTGVTLVASYFFEEETRLSDQINRAEGTTRQYWTYPTVPGASLADKPLYILTSHHTFSAPESLAYDLQALQRATVVGENTGGGAHGTMEFRLTDLFKGSVPFSTAVNPITGTDWEGVGVKPDVSTSADQALLTAHLLALRSSLENRSHPSEIAEELRVLIAEKEAELASMRGGPEAPTR